MFHNNLHTLILITAIALYSSSTYAAAPANDDFLAATEIITTNTTYTGSNEEATIEQDEPNHVGYGSNSVWWKWTPTQNQACLISTLGSDFDTVLAIYTGSAINSLSLVTENDDYENYPDNTSRVTFTALAGQTYYIAVDGFIYTQENITIYDQGNVSLRINTFESPPPNDNFNNALMISESTVTYTGSNISATLEYNEPDAEGTWVQSVWWQWTPANSEPWTFSTMGSDFDTIIAVYTGASFNDPDDPLIQVVSNDDGPIDMTSIVNLNVEAGTTYHIAVYGYDYEEGGFQEGSLHLNSLRPGDVNHDGSVNLVDVITCLRVVAGETADTSVYVDADINSDTQLGIAEAIYLLHNLSQP